MLFGLASSGGSASREVITRFVLVAASPFVWAGIIGILLAKGRNAVVLFGFTLIAFVTFIGAIDFANGRPPYRWVAALLS